MAVASMETGLGTRSQVPELTIGPMDENISVTGLITTCMAGVSIRGKTVAAMKVNISTIKSKVSAFTLGQMVDSITESGGTESSMVRVNTSYHRECREEVPGAKGSERSGSMPLAYPHIKRLVPREAARVKVRISSPLKRQVHNDLSIQ